MSTRNLVRGFTFVTVLALLAGASWAAAAPNVAPPANAPAKVQWDAGQGKVSLTCHGTVVLDAVVVARDKDGKETRVDITMQPTVTKGEKVEQRLKFVPAKPQEGVELVLRGMVIGSEEAFPAETRSEAQKRFAYVRNSVGLSRNLRNNAVYDRRWDWVLIGPANGQTRIKPKRVDKQRITFSWESNGSHSTGSGRASVELVFRGKKKGSFTAPAQDKNNGLQVFAIREARPHPWVISTTRHISQGGVSLLDEKWDSSGKVLAGRSAVVTGDPYVMSVHVPAGYRLKSAEVTGEKVKIDAAAPVASVRITPSATKTVEWKMTFAE